MIALVFAWAGLVGAYATIAPPPTPPLTPSIEEIEEVLVLNRPERIAEMRKHLWNTPLGLLMSDYLFAETSPEQVTRRAHQITTRLYASARLRLARLSAIHAMFLDLYERGRMDGRVQLRKEQLETEITMKKHIAEDRWEKRLLKLTPLFLSLGILGGSHIVREQTGALIEAAAIRLGLERRLKPVHALHAFEPGFVDLISEEFFVEYSIGHGLAVGTSAAGSVAGLFWFFQNGADEGSGLEVMNYLLQKSSDLEDL